MTTHIRHYRAGEPTPETSVTIWLTLTIRDEALTPEWARLRGRDVKEIQPSLPDLIRQSMRRLSMDHRVIGERSDAVL
jgi:hypothetical protein